MVEALDLTLNKMIPLYSTFNSEEWRWGRYICEDVDLVLKAYKPVLDAVYNRFSGRKAKSGQKKFMAKEEWAEVCMQAGLVNDQFAAREMDLTFNLAMSTRLNELNESKHMEMTFVEFLEALSRACEKASFPPIGKEGKMPLGTLQAQALKTKLENVMPALLRVCPKSVQETFIPPYSKK